ncbi:MAG: WD40/YVTN/BNR-like repeat-containing protein [Limisphaerales bacterium]
MKRSIISLLFCVLIAAFFPSESLHAQGTAFTYQGQLNDGGAPANGSYDLTFALFNTNVTGTALAGTLTNSATAVSNGLFTVTLDFSNQFNGASRWLQIGVRTNGASGFTALSPRQQLTPTPYAIFANSASNLSGTLPASQLGGTLPASAFAGYTNTVALTNGGNLFSGTFNGIFSGTFGGIFNGSFFGNGGGVTNVNVVNLTGVLADNQLPANTAFVNSNQTFSGANIFTNFNNSFQGSFFGNGLVGWIATNGTAIQAAIDHGYLLTSPQLVMVTLPPSANPDDIIRISGAGASGWQVKESSGQSILGNFASYGSSSPVGLPTGGNYQDVAASLDGTRMYAVGNGFSGVQVSADSGRDWSQAGLLSSICQSVACSANGQIVYAVTTTDAIFTSTNGGAAWSAVSGSATTISCTADGSKTFTGNIACSGNGTYLATFTSSSISVSTNSGSSYFSIPVPAANLSCLAVSGDCNRLVTGVTNGLLYGSANLGATWTSITSSNQFWSGAWMSQDGSKFAATVKNNGSTIGGVYDYSVNVVAGTISTNSTISGSQGTAIELQCISNNQWMPVSSSGTIWAY